MLTATAAPGQKAALPQTRQQTGQSAALCSNRIGTPQ